MNKTSSSLPKHFIFRKKQLLILSLIPTHQTWKKKTKLPRLKALKSLISGFDASSVLCPPPATTTPRGTPRARPTLTPPSSTAPTATAPPTPTALTDTAPPTPTAPTDTAATTLTLMAATTSRWAAAAAAAIWMSKF